MLRYKVFRGPSKPDKINFQWGRPGPNKLQAFEKFHEHGVPHVPYTARKETAQAWLRKGSTVFARTTGGQGGSGITIVEEGGNLPDRPLYTKYVKKKKEFRVHVFQGEVIDVQQKRKRNGIENGGLIRNLANGWVFCHEDIVEPTGLRDAGLAAVRALDLPFGAVDIIWNERENRCYVLEVNTAPGLCETTAGKYSEAVLTWFKAQPNATKEARREARRTRRV